MNIPNGIIFDLGGTLLDYEGLPSNWSGYYKDAFRYAIENLELSVSNVEIQNSIDILRSYNPRINPREHEVSSNEVFIDVIKNWRLSVVEPNQVAKAFYSYFQRRVRIYDDTLPTLSDLKNMGIALGILSDTPTGMPSSMIREDAGILVTQVDCFLTSEEVGWRKPSKHGGMLISKRMGVPINEMIIVGDEEKDMVLAKNLGIPAILLNRESRQMTCHRDYMISKLSELMDLMRD